VVAAELAAPRRVLREMANAGAGSTLPGRRSDDAHSSRWRVRPALLVALVLSLILHLAWSLWPVEFVPSVSPERPVLTATLAEMPPAPAPPAPPPVVAPAPSPKPPPLRKPRRIAHAPVIARREPAQAQQTQGTPAAERQDATAAVAATTNANAAAPSLADVVIGPPADDKVPVVLPPRLELAYKVFFGTQGFMIGHATYRFEHEGDRYRISTLVEPSGLAALFVHGRGLVESRGTITPDGLKPYEFAIERGSADKREVAYFDWDAGNVLLKGGELTPMQPPAFDPLTIMWQPYFSPPTREDQTFSLATTRRVARYTLSLEGEETIPWRNGEVLTQRWHELSDDGRAEGWFWLAPSMHFIPVKMRVTRTSRGTLEAVLDAIRTDADGATVTQAEQQAADNAPFKPENPMLPNPGGAESHGQ
jgi:hypothetical protein